MPREIEAFLFILFKNIKSKQISNYKFLIHPFYQFQQLGNKYRIRFCNS